MQCSAVQCLPGTCTRVKRTVGLSGHRTCSHWGSNNVKEKLKIREVSEHQNTATKEAVSENLVRKETLSYNKSSGEDVPDHSGSIKAVPDDRC